MGAKMVKVEMLTSAVRHMYKPTKLEDGSTIQALAGTKYYVKGDEAEWPADDAERMIEQGYAKALK